MGIQVKLQQTISRDWVGARGVGSSFRATVSSPSPAEVKRDPHRLHPRLTKADALLWPNKF
jgi:hypothetical protein